MPKDEVVIKETVAEENRGLNISLSENLIDITIANDSAIEKNENLSKDLGLKSINSIENLSLNSDNESIEEELSIETEQNIIEKTKDFNINFNRLIQIKNISSFKIQPYFYRRKIINNNYSNTLNKSFYTKTWKRLINCPNCCIPTDRDIFLITDNENFYKNLLSQITNLILITKNKEINKNINSDSNKVYFYEDEDYKGLFDNIPIKNDLCEIILDLSDSEYFSENYFKGDIYESFNKVSDLIKEVGNHNKMFSINIIINELYKVTGSEQFNPHKSLTLGPAKVAPQEYNNIKCKITDIDKKTSEKNIIASINSHEFESVYRNNFKWEKSFEKIEHDFFDPPTNDDILKEKGVYLIAGGLGNIGLNVAEFLSKEYKANLILINRFTDPMDNLYLSDKILEFEGNGSDILLKKANVINYSTLEKAFIEGIEKFGRINGVINASDIKYTSRLIAQRNKEDNINLETKIQSSKNLASLAEKFNCEFMLILSSIDSIKGIKGSSEVTSANLFLDSLSDFYTNGNLRFISTNWVQWADLNGSLRTKNLKSRSKKNNKVISKKEGLKLLKKIINSHYNSIIISPVELDKI